MTVSECSAEGSAAGALRAGLDQPLEERERRPADVSGGDDLDAGTVGDCRGVEENPGERAPAPHHVLRLAFPAAVFLARVVLEVDEAPGAYDFHRWARMEHDAGRDAIGAEFALQCDRIAKLADFEKDPAVSLLGYCPGRQLSMSAMAGLMAGWQQRGHGNCGTHGRRGHHPRTSHEDPAAGTRPVLPVPQPVHSFTRHLGGALGERLAQIVLEGIGFHRMLLI